MFENVEFEYRDLSLLIALLAEYCQGFRFQYKNFMIFDVNKCQVTMSMGTMINEMEEVVLNN